PFHQRNLVEIYQIPVAELEAPLVLELQRGHRLTGDLVESNSDTFSLHARGGVNPPGYMFFVEGIHLRAGQYAMTVHGTFDPVDESVPLIRLELGRDCSRVLNPKHADESGAFSESVFCSLDQTGILVPRIYWFGQ